MTAKDNITIEIHADLFYGKLIALFLQENFLTHKKCRIKVIHIVTSTRHTPLELLTTEPESFFKFIGSSPQFFIQHKLAYPFLGITYKSSHDKHEGYTAPLLTPDITPDTTQLYNTFLNCREEFKKPYSRLNLASQLAMAGKCIPPSQYANELGLGNIKFAYILNRTAVIEYLSGKLDKHYSIVDAEHSKNNPDLILKAPIHNKLFHENDCPSDLLKIDLIKSVDNRYLQEIYIGGRRYTEVTGHSEQHATHDKPQVICEKSSQTTLYLSPERPTDHVITSDWLYLQKSLSIIMKFGINLIASNSDGLQLVKQLIKNELHVLQQQVAAINELHIQDNDCKPKHTDKSTGLLELFLNSGKIQQHDNSIFHESTMCHVFEALGYKPKNNDLTSSCSLTEQSLKQVLNLEHSINNAVKTAPTMLNFIESIAK